MNFAQALEAGVAQGLDRLDVQLLLLESLGRASSERAWLLTHDERELDTESQKIFDELCRRRAGGEPLAYIAGHKEFFGLDLKVDPRVLVPRPDTETLVEWARDHLAGQPRVLDLGTGSGAVALALQHLNAQARIEAVELSEDALALARENGRRLGLAVEFRCAFWLEGSVGAYDLIVSNPPYVAKDDPHLRALAHEPLSALSSGEDGLDDIRSITAQAPAHLKPGGWLLLEHGWDQAEAVRDLLRSAGLRHVTSRRDLAGIERCSGGQKLELG